jgi:omega-6 fatty acid desaturase (delta-12 desaturase)
VTEEVKAELWEALGDSPIGAFLGCAKYLVGGCIFSVSKACG